MVPCLGDAQGVIGEKIKWQMPDSQMFVFQASPRQLERASRQDADPTGRRRQLHRRRRDFVSRRVDRPPTADHVPQLLLHPHGHTSHQQVNLAILFINR